MKSKSFLPFRWFPCLLAVSAFFMPLAPVATAQGPIALTGRISTLGPGGDIAYSLTDQVTIRLAGHYFKYSYDDNVDDIDYDLDLRLASGGLLVDWHPFNGSFRVTGGGLFYGNRVTGDARPNQPTEIGDNTYTPEQIGRLDAKLDFDSVVPYLGIGWGNPFAGKRWTFTFDLGVVYHGSPDVRLTSDGAGSNNPQFQEDLRREEQKFKDEIADFRFWPVVAIGLSYRF